MSRVIASATVSLDGFIADESDRVGPLFDWYNNGAVPFNGGDPERVFHVSAASGVRSTGDDDAPVDAPVDAIVDELGGQPCPVPVGAPVVTGTVTAIASVVTTMTAASTAAR